MPGKFSKRLTSLHGKYAFRSVVFSHGWADLPPFYVQDETPLVHLVISTASGAKDVLVKTARNGFCYEVGETVSKTTEIEIEKALRWMFRLDDNLAQFYQHADRNGLSWISKMKMGKLLRSQTVFEDIIKLILTTNCGWSLTRILSDRLVENLGEKSPEGFGLFPTPEKLASKPESFYRKTIRAGYRSPHLPKLAKMCLKKEFSVEKWCDPNAKTEEVRKEILKLPGAGPYVADNLLRLLGRYDYLGLDSWARAKIAANWNNGKQVPDKKIYKHYEKHKPYSGLVLWCELTRDWLEQKDFSTWIRTETR